MRSLIVALFVLTLASGAGAEGVDPLFVVIYRPGPAWKVGTPLREQPGMGAHGAYMKRLFDEGRTFAAGPMTDAPGGVLVLQAHDLADAQALLAADPSISSGLFRGEVHGWAPAFRSDKPLPKSP